MQSKWNFHTLLEGLQHNPDTLENYLAISYNVKNTLIIQLCNPLPAIYLSEMKPYVHAKTYMWMFIVTLFVIVQNWKQSKCLN